MSQLIPFQFESHQCPVRLDADHNPWWVLQDVCRALGIQKPSDVKKRLRPHETTILDFVEDRIPRQFLLVNESGLYRVIMRSNKPDAERFQDWVFQEVLPQIRKAGSFTHPASSTINQFTELKAIAELAQSTAEARVAAEEARLKAHEAEIRSVRAESKADMALDEAHRMTMSGNKQTAGWLRKFCESYGLPTWKASVHGKIWEG